MKTKSCNHHHFIHLQNIQDTLGEKVVRYAEHTALLQLRVVTHLLHSCNRDRRGGLLRIGQA